MAAPTFTQSSTESKGRVGECILEMVLTSGSIANGNASIPTEGQLWPRGNS